MFKALRIAFLLLVLFTMWLGPFLGLLLRRGRGAALITYGLAKLAVALALLGWWWGHGIAGDAIPLWPLAPSLAWHLFGVALALFALAGASPPRPRPVNENLSVFARFP